MATTVSAAKAKAEFAEYVRKAEAGDPVVITRHGKAVVALVPAHHLEQFQRLRAAGPSAGLVGLAGGWRRVGGAGATGSLDHGGRKRGVCPASAAEPMAYLFDTDAISELLKPRPKAGYVRWLASIPREEQFTSAVVGGRAVPGGVSLLRRRASPGEHREKGAACRQRARVRRGGRSYLRTGSGLPGSQGSSAGRRRPSDRCDGPAPRSGARDGKHQALHACAGAAGLTSPG